MPSIEQFETRASDLAGQSLADAGRLESVVSAPDNQRGDVETNGLCQDGSRVGGGSQGRKCASASCGGVETIEIGVNSAIRDLRALPKQAIAEQCTKHGPSQKLLIDDATDD